VEYPREKVGVCRAAKGRKLRLTGGTQADYSSGIQVVVHHAIHTVIADVGNFECEPAWKRTLHSKVPRFDVGIPEVGINCE